MSKRRPSRTGSVGLKHSNDHQLAIDKTALRDAVRRAMRLAGVRTCSVGLLTAGLAGMVPAAGAEPFPATLELSSLFPAFGGDGSAGFVLRGVDVADFRFRSEVSCAGDVNGDGIDDVIIGAQGAEPVGESYVVFGQLGGFPAIFELSDLFSAAGGDGSQGFVIKGITDYSGGVVAGPGDVNGDGIDDLVIGQDGANVPGGNSAGATYVVFGRLTGFPAEFELASLVFGGDGSDGFVLTGVGDNDTAGFAARGAGDVNGDGIRDLIIGAPGASDSRGDAYVFFGRDTGFPPVLSLGSLLPSAGGDGSEGFLLEGVRNGDQVGWSVSAAGDVNGDGIDDILAGSHDANDGAGESYVVFGSTSGFAPIIPLSSLFPAAGGDGSKGFVLRGIDPFDRSGWSLSSAGDVNGDGIDDVLVGARSADPGGINRRGESYVVFGRNTGFPAVVDLGSLFPAGGGDGSDGFVLLGADSEDESGRSVSAAGDVNGDGIDDVIIGAPSADPNLRNRAGESYVIFGRESGFPATLGLGTLFPAGGGDGSQGFVLKGVRAEDYSGYSVSSAGDVNGDGIDDVIIGAYFFDDFGNQLTGERYLIFGRADIAHR